MTQSTKDSCIPEGGTRLFHAAGLRRPMMLPAVLLLAACGGSSGVVVDAAENAPSPLADDAPASTVGGDAGEGAGTDGDTATDGGGTDGSGADTVSRYQSPPGVAACSNDDLKAKVDYDMRDYYLYYDQVPDLSLDSVESPEALMTALRVDPDVYSFVTDDTQVTQLREEGITSGYGFWFRPDGADSIVRFREVLVGSPADSAGIERGDELIAINDTLIGDFSDSRIGEVLSASQVRMRVRTGDAAPRDVSMRDGDYRWITAPSASIITVNTTGLRVGYLPVRRFLDTTPDEVDNELAWFVEQGIDDLVIDLRYNPGGRSSAARRLAGQIGGAAIAGQIYQIASANDKYPDAGFETRFEAASLSLDLSRVVVLTTGFSASASEALINGLQPYLDVIVVGERTEGKPFSSYSEVYCDKSINAMSLIRTNADGVDVVGGIEPGCAVTDEWSFPQGDSNNDALLSAGVTRLETGACPSLDAALTKHGRDAGRDVVATPGVLEYRAMGGEQLRAQDLFDR